MYLHFGNILLYQHVSKTTFLEHKNFFALFEIFWNFCISIISLRLRNFHICEANGKSSNDTYNKKAFTPLLCFWLSAFHKWNQPQPTIVFWQVFLKMCSKKLNGRWNEHFKFSGGVNVSVDGFLPMPSNLLVTIEDVLHLLPKNSWEISG